MNTSSHSIKALSIPQSMYIVSTGRSGTTVLAKALSGHPELVVRSQFPYENRSSQYLFTWGMNGRDAEIPYLAVDKTSSVKYQLYQRGDNQSKDWFADNKEVVLRNRAINIADEYYEYIATVENKPSPKAYVEKAIGIQTVMRMHKWGWPLTGILLIRDPRDILLSVNSFNKKHEIEGFGADKFDDRELLRRYIAFFIGIRKSMAGSELPGVELKYEDLIVMPEKELSRVARALGIDYSDASINRMIDSYSYVDSNVTQHRTQENQSRVSRWQDEASNEQLEMFWEFESDLNGLNYTNNVG